MINKNSPYELDESLFRRNQFYGTTFTWYAVDSINSIAKFTSGYYPIPINVFRSKSKYLETDNYMENLPLICDSLLSPRYKELRKRVVGNFSLALLEANQGLFSFDEQSNWTNKYELVSIPSKELKTFNLPLEIQHYLNQFKIENITFNDTEEIDILEYFECDLTPEK